jgi:phycocyanobilin lyase beta subunit
MTLTPTPGTADPLQLVTAVEEAATAADLLRATQTLAAAADCGAPDRVIACLVDILGFNNPGAAVAAVEGLIAIGAAAVAPLLDGLDEHNYGARAWAVRALAGIGDVRGLELLEQALGNDIGPSVRRAAAHGLGALRLAALPPHDRLAVRERCLVALERARADGEWVVRYAVAVGLEALVQRMQPSAEESRLAAEALEALCCSEAEDTPVVRLRASMARQRLPITP